eukprot:NODE_43_length_28809_cov_0.237200.p3 type:complete len:781 gc:universal NODE_43_length_28809_cov_0.237200:25502-23160(-)
MLIMWTYVKGFAKIGKYSIVMGTASGVGFATYIGAQSHQFIHRVQSNISDAFHSTKQHAYQIKEGLSDSFQNMAVSIQDEDDDFTLLVKDAIEAWKAGVIETLEKSQPQDHADELEITTEALVMNSLPHDQFNPFIKKLLHVQTLLEDLSDAGLVTDIQLPSIVVIGSQSCGKTSVLEAIIGHEFLPKGSNLVTKRPLELTLVNDPDVYAVFDDMKDLGKITSFTQVSKTVKALNNSISIEEIEHAKPIKLTIYSPFVPDLRLIDLPGYIRVVSADQPASLKNGIEALCEQYVQHPNIILAISAADVDLANSDALRVSKQVDPLGKRTLGVLTKLDKVEPQEAANLLNNKQFPLSLGYIGVVCPPGKPVVENAFPNESVGFPTLRLKLVDILTNSMKSYTESTLSLVLDVLDKEKYNFNVSYFDTKQSPTGYIDGLHDQVKQHLRQTVRSYTEQDVLLEIQQLLHGQLFDILESSYLVDSEIGSISESEYWVNKLMHATSKLTKSGIGRIATHSIFNTAKAKLGLHNITSFEHHQELKLAVDSCIEHVVKERLLQTVDQIEHILKPWKVEQIGSNVEDIWESSRLVAINALKQEMNLSQAQFKAIQSSFGRWTFPTLIKDLQAGRQMEEQDIKLLQQALYHESRSELLKIRINQLNAKKCKAPLTPLYDGNDSNMNNHILDSSLNPINRANKQSVTCPEVFLFALASQMSVIAAKYIWLDLVLETYTRLPLELEDRVFQKYRAISRELIDENPKIKNQIQAQERIELLEKIGNELRRIIQ